MAAAPTPRGRDRWRRRGSALLGALALLAGLGIGWWLWPAPAAPNWMPAFIAPLQAPIAGDPTHDAAALRFADVTLRQFVPLALPGTRFRLRLSNQFGDRPLQIGAVHAAWRSERSGVGLRDGSDRAVQFDGRQSATLAPGATLLSDPFTLPPGPRADLGLSLYLPQPTPLASWHLVGSRSSYRSAPGAHLGASDFPIAAVDRSLYFTAAVEVDAPPGAALWVAFGDSITDGAWHSVDADASWPLQWAHMLRQQASTPQPIGVLNAGVGGNRLLTELNGPSGLQRFDRDVLSLRGVTGVLLAIGINDIGSAPAVTLPAAADQLMAGLDLLRRRAQARGMVVVAATLTPVGGSDYGRPDVEAARQRVNRWIRLDAGFDAVVDFDAVIRDPALPQRIRPDWTSDRLHPDDAGYRAMAAEVMRVLAAGDLLRRRSSSP